MSEMVNVKSFRALLDDLNDHITTEAAKRDRAIDRVRQDNWDRKRATMLWLDIKREEAIYTLATYEMLYEREYLIQAIANIQEQERICVRVQNTL